MQVVDRPFLTTIRRLATGIQVVARTSRSSLPCRSSRPFSHHRSAYRVRPQSQPATFPRPSTSITSTLPTFRSQGAIYPVGLTAKSSFHTTPAESATKHPIIRWKREKMSPSAITSEDAYSLVFSHNTQWRASLKEKEPELFARLAEGQSPQILWIGCSDSRCPETTILGLQPGDVFVHRNIANILTPTDLNSLSVIQYAVQYLKVKHIVVCGHTCCGGVGAALGNKRLGLIDAWLMPLRTLRKDNLKLLDGLANDKERSLKLVELNVRSGCDVILQNPDVIDAIAERDLRVHGLIYDVGSGEMNELDIEENDDVVRGRKTAFKVAV